MNNHGYKQREKYPENPKVTDEKKRQLEGFFQKASVNSLSIRFISSYVQLKQHDATQQHLLDDILRKGRDSTRRLKLDQEVHSDQEESK